MIILINAISVEYKFQENEFFDDKGEYLFGEVLSCLSNQHDRVVMSIFCKKINMRKVLSAKNLYLCG